MNNNEDDKKLYDLDDNNPNLDAYPVNLQTRASTGRHAQLKKHSCLPKSVVFADEFAADLARALGVPQKIAIRVLDLMGIVIRKRLVDGKPCGFPGFGGFYVNTRLKPGRFTLRREIKSFIQERVRVLVGDRAPLTEPLNEQYRKAREAYFYRKKARKEIFLSSGRRIRDRANDKKREADD